MTLLHIVSSSSSLVLSSWPLAGFGKTLRVPAEHKTIQAALNAAQPGDEVHRRRPAPTGNVSPSSRRVTLRSEGDNTDGQTRARFAPNANHHRWKRRPRRPPASRWRKTPLLDGFTVTGVGTYDDAKWKKHWEERGENQKHEHIGGFGAPGIGIDGVTCIVAALHRPPYRSHRDRRSGRRRWPIQRSHRPQQRLPIATWVAGSGSWVDAGGIVRGNIPASRTSTLESGIATGRCPSWSTTTATENIRAGIGVSEGLVPGRAQ